MNARMWTRSSKIASAAALSLLTFTGCKSEERASAEPRPAEPVVREQAASPLPGALEEPRGMAEPREAPGSPPRAGAPVVLTVIGVDLDPRLAELCGIPRNKLFFEFDSAKLPEGSRELLGEIATCAKAGAAKGKELLVVGRADPRGPDEYNEKLGMSRAESVAEYLKKQGVSTARVETESKGEQGAAESPLGWPSDRRVTIRLKE